MKSLTDEIKMKAFEIGFSKIGIAKAEELVDERKRLESWFSKNFHGEMEWMHKNYERRLDPRLVMADTKSVIVGAFNYNFGRRKGKHATHKISKHALGNDYHEVISKKMNSLLDFIKVKKTETKGDVFVDSSPVMEKVWAKKSGLGWIGKNSILLSKDIGSWFFLGVLLIDLELEYDTPTTGHCGTCTICVDACPTNALVTPYVLDARSCIAYRNIEQKTQNEMPIFQNLDGWIYGCDVCQDVCPWNNNLSNISSINEFIPNNNIVNLNPSDFNRIKHDEFNNIFQNSSIKRIKYKKFKENVTRVEQSRKLEKI
jgi:epoxyqueuosine reductase